MIIPIDSHDRSEQTCAILHGPLTPSEQLAIEGFMGMIASRDGLDLEIEVGNVLRGELPHDPRGYSFEDFMTAKGFMNNPRVNSTAPAILWNRLSGRKDPWCETVNFVPRETVESIVRAYFAGKSSDGIRPTGIGFLSLLLDRFSPGLAPEDAIIQEKGGVRLEHDQRGFSIDDFLHANPQNDIKLSAGAVWKFLDIVLSPGISGRAKNRSPYSNRLNTIREQREKGFIPRIFLEAITVEPPLIYINGFGTVRRQIVINSLKRVSAPIETVE